MHAARLLDGVGRRCDIGASMSETKLPTVALVVVAALVGGVAGSGATWMLSREPGAAAKPKAEKAS